MISHNPTSGYFRHVLVRFAKQYQHLAKIHLDWRLLLGSQERLHTGNEQKAFLGSGRSGYGSFFLDTHFYIYMLYIHVCTCLKYTYIQSIYIIDIHTYMCAGWWFQHLWQNIKVNGKDNIPYMKWKIKAMFQTTNQHLVTETNLDVGRRNGS